MEILFISGILPITISVIFIYITVGFLVSLLLKRNDIADVMWGPGIVLVGILGFIISEGAPLNTIILVLMALWGVRLSVRIGLKNAQRQEDARYKELSGSWGRWFLLRSYIEIFLLQGFLMILVGYPALHVALFGGTLTILGYCGVAVWFVGFFFEAVGDYQLDRFLNDKKNKGTILHHGLWKYSRHPNYFGEVVQWWGIFLIVASTPFWWAALISPVTITVLILFVSGIPMLEKSFESNPEFQEYKRKTSAFFPLPPKKSSP